MEKITDCTLDYGFKVGGKGRWPIDRNGNLRRGFDNIPAKIGGWEWRSAQTEESALLGLIRGRFTENSNRSHKALAIRD